MIYNITKLFRLQLKYKGLIKTFIVRE